MAVAILGLLAGCVTLIGEPGQDNLEQRVTAFWNARQAGDEVTAYEFEEVKATGEQTLQQYVRKKGGIAYQQVEVKDIERIDENQAVAKLDVEYRILGLSQRKPLKSEVEDPWVKIDGQWYHRQRPSLVETMLDRKAQKK